MTQPQIINAFHPLFMQTYYPDFWKEFKRNAVNSQKTTEAVTKLREKRPTHGTMFGISTKTVSTRAPSMMRKTKGTK